MLPTRVGQSLLKRAAATAAAALLLLSVMPGVAAADGTLTGSITGQTPNPVVRGNLVDYSITISNPEDTARAFEVTSVTGADGVSVSSSGCQTIAAGSSGALSTVVLGTTSATPAGTDTLTFTVAEYDGAVCGGSVASTMAGTADLVVALPPLTLTMYKVICPTYADVPANTHGNPDDTGGNAWQESDGHRTLPITWAGSIMPACQPVPGWDFQFITGDQGSVIGDSGPTGPDGSVTLDLNSDFLARARSGSGLWVREFLYPNAPYDAPFGIIRCYMDAINDDNEEQITNVSDDVSQVWCVAYNVGTPTLTLTKTADSTPQTTPTTYDTLDQPITYTYTLTNTSKVPVFGPFSIQDDKLGTVDCVGAPAMLAPNEPAITCTATHQITQADLNDGSVSNSATAEGQFGNGHVYSNPSAVTINATQKPALALVKSSTTGSFAKSGDSIDYTYTLTNSGNVTLDGPFSVTDDKIASVDCSGAAASLAPGEDTACTATYVVKQADVDAGKVTNTAAGQGFFGTTPVTSAKSTLTVAGPTPDPALTLVKSTTTASFTKSGDSIDYTYTLTNSGNVTLDGPFSVTDDKIASVDCSAADVGLAPGEDTACTATYVVKQADVDAGKVTNTATGHASFDGTTVDSGRSSVTVNGPVAAPALGLVKSTTTASYAKKGDSISYTYTLTNAGNVTLDGPFSVTDDKIASVDCSAAATSLAPGATTHCTASYLVGQADVDAGKVTNTATGHATFAGKPIDSATSSVTVFGPATNPALTLVKSSTTTSYAAVGDKINYTYKLTNTGNVTLTGPFTVTDNKFAATIACANAGTTIVPGGPAIACTAQYTVAQTDLDAGSVTNIATADATFNGNVVHSNSSSVTVRATQRPGLSISKKATEETYSKPGDLLHYTYTLKNTGNVTLVAPFAVADDKITGSNSVNCSTAPASLAPGASATCTAAYSVTQANINVGSVTNLAIASAHFGSRTIFSLPTGVTVTATQTPAISLVKSAAPGVYDTVGQVIDYTYVIKNTGNVTLNPLYTITDDKVGVSCPPVPLFLAPGNTVTCTSKYYITLDDLNAGSVTNTASASALHLLTRIDSAPTTLKVVLGQNPVLTLVKSSSTTSFAAKGDKIDYTYTLTNTGNVTLTGPFKVTDNKIDSNNAFTCGAADATIAPAGPAVTCTAQYTVVQADIDAGHVTNLATAHVIFGTVAVSSNTDSVTVAAAGGSQKPAIALAKSTNPDPTGFSAAGDEIEYSYSITNTGNVTLSGPFLVSDDKINSGDPFTCGAADASIAPAGPAITCTAEYTVVGADVTAGKVTNMATASVQSGDSRIVSGPASVTVNISQLGLEKSASKVVFLKAGETIDYTYTLTNNGPVALSGPFSVTDDKITDGNSVTCPQSPATLAAGASIDCSATYTVTAADVAAGKVTNTATGGAFLGSSPMTSNTATFTVDAARLSIVKAAVTTTFSKAGDTIDYTYTLTNSSTVTLSGPFSVSDDKITGSNSVVCPATPDSLVAGSSIICTATYTVTTADITAGKVTNTATGHARYGDFSVDTDPAAVTVKVNAPDPTQIVLSETATPAHTATPPVTSSERGSTGGDAVPLLALLVCLAFGGLGLMAVQAQRRSINR